MMLILMIKLGDPQKIICILHEHVEVQVEFQNSVPRRWMVASTRSNR